MTWTSEEIYREVMEALGPKPKPLPKPPLKPTDKAQERWANPPDEAIIQNAAKSNEALIGMALGWKDRRSEQLAKEYAEWNEAGKDPRVRYQRQLDAHWEQQRKLADALDDGYVEVGGFRERRKGAQSHKAKGDPDYGL
jgi:hypothetical protein